MSTYKPKIVRARLHTKRKRGDGEELQESGRIRKAREYFDGLEVFLSLWEYDRHSAWHLWNWKKEDDEMVMLAFYEAEQEHPLQRYKGDFKRFKEDWKAGEYDPVYAYTFSPHSVEVLEVIQEEENNIDKAEVKKKITQAKEAEYQKRRRQRMKKRNRHRKRSWKRCEVPDCKNCPFPLCKN